MLRESYLCNHLCRLLPVAICDVITGPAFNVILGAHTDPSSQTTRRPYVHCFSATSYAQMWYLDLGLRSVNVLTDFVPFETVCEAVI